MPRSALTGTRIRERRTLAGVRQADLARAVGISPAYLNLIEHNRRKVPAALVDAIAAALKVDAKALAEGGEGALFEALREAAGTGLPDTAGQSAPEIDRTEEFVSRFPGWAGLLADRQGRVRALERVVEDLSDRMARDPHLSAAMHEVLSAVTSVRSTAAILAETEDIEPEWRARFHANLGADSERLTEAAGALVAYLDTIDMSETGLSSPQEEVEAWLLRLGYVIPEAEGDGAVEALIREAPELATEAARTLARGYIGQAQKDARALPLAAFSAAIAEVGPDPGRLQAATGQPLPVVMRRLAAMPRTVADVGLVVSDGSGAFTFRRPVEGFSLPRHGAACALWPLYEALRQPMVPVRRIVETAARLPRRFVAYAWCDLRSPSGFEGPQVAEALMLLVPADPAAAGQAAVRPIGPACRTCPRGACSARREPSILTAAI